MWTDLQLRFCGLLGESPYREPFLSKQSLPSFRWCFFSLLSKTFYPFWPPWSGVLLQVLNFANISLGELLRITTTHQTFWGRLTLTQTVFAPLLGNRAILNNVCLSDAPQVCGRGEKTPVEISYNRKSPTCFHWESGLKILQLSVFWQQSEYFRAEAGVPRRGRFGEFAFRNIPYVRKADNCLEYKVFAARPEKKKKKYFSTT